MKRRNTVSVTPAMGASTVAGEISIPPIKTEGGTTNVARAPSPAMAARCPTELSQPFRTWLFYFLCKHLAICHNPLSLKEQYAMISKLREILLTQYIGSILVALLVWQAVVEIWTIAVRSGFWAYSRLHSESVMGVVSRSPFAWDRMIFSAITIVLYLLTAWGLARWLFPPATQPRGGEAEGEPSSDQP